MQDDTIHEAFPYLRVRDANAAIDFYIKAFGAKEQFRRVEPGGRVGHAQLGSGSFTVILADEYPEYGIQGPEAFGGTGSSVHLHVEDVGAMTKQAVDAGAKIIMEPKDQFYGERSSKVLDPFGHEWLLGSDIEDVTPEEMQRRFTAMFENCDRPFKRNRQYGLSLSVFHGLSQMSARSSHRSRFLTWRMQAVEMCLHSFRNPYTSCRACGCILQRTR